MVTRLRNYDSLGSLKRSQEACQRASAVFIFGKPQSDSFKFSQNPGGGTVKVEQAGMVLITSFSRNRAC